jgi:hypothetical protein
MRPAIASSDRQSHEHVQMRLTPCCTPTLFHVGEQGQAQGPGVHSLSGGHSQHRCSMWSGNRAMGKRPQEGRGPEARTAGPAAAAQRRSGRPHHCSGESGARQSDWKHDNMATLTNPGAAGLPHARRLPSSATVLLQAHCMPTHRGCHSVGADGSAPGGTSKGCCSSIQVGVEGLGGFSKGLCLRCQAQHLGPAGCDCMRRHSSWTTTTGHCSRAQ